ncbi:hypothetical protein ACWKWU_16650 [Chitinophaga lutea]
MTQKLLIGLLALSAVACRDTVRERALEERDSILSEKERQFALKEADYQSLLRWRDSILSAKDSILPAAAWPADVAGRWSSRTVCKESNCSEYVVGDQRTAVWEFTGDSTGLFTKVTDRNVLTRVYNGSFDSSTVRLRFLTDSAAPRQVTMDVELSRGTPGPLKGSLVLKMESGCSARFAVELVRASN